MHDIDPSREGYIGLPYEQARALAETKGWRPRRLTADMVITLEFRDGRLNLVVDDHDIVVDARTG